MKRRNFVKGTSLTAVAISAAGFIRLDDGKYLGDCQTTTDILGPFYRPNAPVRDNLVIEGMPGEEIILRGSIFHNDCNTKLTEAKIELWHCSADEVYDNDSQDYNYRGTTFTDDNGKYAFRTQMPVPYDAGGGMYRPAHFHLMISATGYQNLVTQLYFTGDPYLEKDRSSNAPNAKSRILDIEKSGDVLSVTFDVVMQKELPVEKSVLDRLVGSYQYDDSKEPTEFFIHENQLWIRNEVFGRNLRYRGNNTFELPNRTWGQFEVKFEIGVDGKIKFIQTETSSSGKAKTKSGRRV